MWLSAVGYSNEQIVGTQAVLNVVTGQNTPSDQRAEDYLKGLR